ncbi:MAG: sulfate adenylyltransferase subunit CysD [Alphaproteobacteria bacterium]
MTSQLSNHLTALEARSIRILREVAAQFEHPVLLYSIGKDSAVLAHLARKAFFPAPVPFPLLHVDTTWKFAQMIAFRDAQVKKTGAELIVHVNEAGRARSIDPFGQGAGLHTEVMKTEALKQALDAHKFDAALGGARRDEEKSRAKERVMSVRTASHGWDPKNQRPEFWQLYNTDLHAGQTMRVFPLSDWTELDVWRYIAAQEIPVVPLYFAARRPVVARDGLLIMADDARLKVRPGEKIEERQVRFRTLGCYPLTGAIESEAATVEAIILELENARVSERQGRAVDRDGASMEAKKREGYF